MTTPMGSTLIHITEVSKFTQSIWAMTLLLLPFLATLFENLNENLISRMDLTEGADDQYRDYSPSQVEAIIFGITKLSPDHQEEILNKLKKHLWEFIQDEEQDEDMVNTYDELYKALVKWEEDHLTPDLIKSLYISKLFQSLKH